MSTPRVPGGMSSGLSAMHHYASWLHGSRRAHPFRPAAGVTLGAWHTTPSALRASPASSPATSRVPAAERGPAQRALDRRLDHDAFRFRQPWSSRDQVMVLGPVAALLGGDKLGHRGRGPGGRRARRAVAGGPSTCRGCRRPLALRELGRAGAARRRSRGAGAAVQVRTFGGLDVRRLQRPAPRRLPRRGSPATGGFNVEPREAAPLDGAHDARHGPCAGSVRSRFVHAISCLALRS